MTRVAVIATGRLGVGHDHTYSGYWLMHVALMAARHLETVLVIDLSGSASKLLVGAEATDRAPEQDVVASRAANVRVLVPAQTRRALVDGKLADVIEAHGADLTLALVESLRDDEASPLLATADKWVLLSQASMASVNALETVYQRVGAGRAERDVVYAVVDPSFREPRHVAAKGLLPDEFRRVWCGGQRAPLALAPEGDDRCVGVVESAFAVASDMMEPLFDLGPEDRGHGLVDAQIIRIRDQFATIVGRLVPSAVVQAASSPPAPPPALVRQVRLLDEQGAETGAAFPLQVVSHRHLVSWIVASPGTGKSHEARALEAQGWGLCKLGATGPGLAASLRANPAERMVLDELDQWAGGVDALANILADWLRDASPRRLMIFSREHAWHQRLVQVLSGRFGVVVRLRLQPLSAAEIEGWATTELGERAAGFVGQVRDGRLEYLAERPLTLRFLLRAFDADDRLTGDRVQLYRRSLARVAKWPDDQVDTQAVVALVKPLAWVATLTGRAFAFEPAKSTLDLIEWCEVFGVSEVALKRALSTALFEPVGTDAWRFAHHAFAESLAAQYALERRVTRAQLRRFLAPSGGRVLPHLEGFEQWLIEVGALPLDTLGAAVRRLQLGWPVPENQRATWLSTLVRAHESGIGDIYWLGDPARFTGPGCEAVGRRMCEHPDEWIRAAGVDVVAANLTEGRGEWLVGVTSDPLANERVRVAGLSTLVAVEPSRVGELKALLDQPDVPRELQARLIIALWPDHLSAFELLALLAGVEPVGSRLRDFTAINAQAIAESVPFDDLAQALRWLAEHPYVPSSGDMPEAWSFAPLLVARAWSTLANDDTREALADLILQWNARGAADLRETPVVWQRTPELNADIFARVVERSESPSELRPALSTLFWLGLVPPAASILDRFEQAVADGRPSAARWVEAIGFAQLDASAVGRLRRHVDVSEKIRRCVDAFDNPTPAVEWPLLVGPAEPTPLQWLEIRLRAFAADQSRWPQVVSAWTRAREVIWRPFSKRPIWRDLDDALKAKMRGAAVEWLTEVEPEGWVTSDLWRTVAIETWVFVNEQGLALPETTWARWAPLFFLIDDEAPAKQALRRVAKDHVGPITADIVRSLIVALPHFAVTILAEALADGWTSEYEEIAVRVLDEAGEKAAHGLLRVIASVRPLPPSVQRWLDARFGQPWVLEEMFSVAPDLTWQRIWPRFLADDEFATGLVERLQRQGAHWIRGPVPDVAALCGRLDALFPAGDIERDEVHADTLGDRVRRALGDLRDALIEAGDVVSVRRVVRSIGAPPRIAGRLIERAERRALELAPPPEWSLAELASNLGRPRTVAELAQLLLDLLGELQEELNGEFSFVLDLFAWKSPRPRPVDEPQVTANIASRLKPRLEPFGVRLSLEPQRHGRRDQIDLVADGEGFLDKLLVEVKWVHNKRFERDLLGQLDKYLDPGEHGIYLALWFDETFDVAETHRPKKALREVESVRRLLGEQAKDANHPIHPFVLEMRNRRR